MPKNQDKKSRKSRFSLFKPRDKQPNFFISVLVNFMAIMLVIAMVAGAGGVGLIMGIAKAYYDTTPEIDIDAITSQNLTSFIYDCNGALITAYKGTENRVWASFDEIPKNLYNAFVATEDARFFTHNGIDIKRIMGAFVSNLRNESTQGGSTITQQLVKNCLLTSEQSYKRKIQEAYLSIELEKEYEKHQILEWYLNIIPLGGSNYGIKAAAKDYYDKDLNELTLRECASLAAITRNPSRYNPRRCYYGSGTPSTINDRTDYVLRSMYENNMISRAEYDAALSDSLQVVEESTLNDLYDMPTAVETVLDDAVTELLKAQELSDTANNRKIIRRQIQTGGYRIYSTIDPTIQRIAEDVIYNWEDYPELANPSDEYSRSTQTEQPQAACVIYDYTTGEVRAVVGSRTPPTQFLLLNRATSANMPVGSSIKPLAVYGPALDKGAAANSIANNLPLPIEGWVSAKGYPANSTTKQYPGVVTLRVGIRNSLNIVAANTLYDRVGIEDSVKYLEAMGIDPDHLNADGSGLALGSSGITVMEMASAYGIIGNKGVYQKPLTFTRITDAAGNVILDMKAEQQKDRHQVFKPGTCYMLVDLMEDAVQRGTGTAARIKGMTVAGKTGTHSDYKSVFFAGLTPYYSGAVWVGHDDFKSLYRGATGGKEAAPIWQAIMERIHTELALEDKEIIEEDPEDLGLVKVKLCALSGKVATEICELDPDFPPTTDWCHYDSVPVEICDQHVSMTVCSVTGQLSHLLCPETKQQAYQIIPPEWGCELMEDEVFYAHFPHGIRGYLSAFDFSQQTSGGVQGFFGQLNSPLPAQMYCTLHGISLFPPATEGEGDVSNVYDPDLDIIRPTETPETTPETTPEPTLPPPDEDIENEDSAVDNVGDGSFDFEGAVG